MRYSVIPTFLTLLLFPWGCLLVWVHLGVCGCPVRGCFEHAVVKLVCVPTFPRQTVTAEHARRLQVKVQQPLGLPGARLWRYLVDREHTYVHWLYNSRVPAQFWFPYSLNFQTRFTLTILPTSGLPGTF